MTVSELKQQLEELEKCGMGDAPVLLESECRTLLEALICGRIECWPDTSRLTKREYRGEGQDPDKSRDAVVAVFIH